MLSEVFRSLAHRRFRHYFLAQAVSAAGFWIQQIALSWTVYRITGSAAMLGAVSFAASIPMLVISPFAGLLVDRVDRRRVVLVTQTIQMLQACVLAILAFTGTAQPALIVVLAFVYGTAWTFDAPARQALLPLMIGGRGDLSNAIALNSLVMNLARFVGPAIAGLLLAWTGEGWCFAINAASFLAVLVVLWRLPSVPPAGRRGRWQEEISDGFRWVWTAPPARRLVLLLALVSFTAPAYQTLMPVFAREVFLGDARIQGLLVSAAGFGALLGTAMLAWRASSRGLPTVIARSAFGAGVALIVFAQTTRIAIAMAALAVVGFGVIVTASGVNTYLQATVDERRRGRVVSVYLMAFLGVAPIGNLLVGSLATAFGAPPTLAVYGAVCMAGALVFALRRD
ncbi:MAG: hypothetical protein RIS35_2122 [Pseudomonadota bacterium]